WKRSKSLMSPYRWVTPRPMLPTSTCPREGTGPDSIRLASMNRKTATQSAPRPIVAGNSLASSIRPRSMVRRSRRASALGVQRRSETEHGPAKLLIVEDRHGAGRLQRRVDGDPRLAAGMPGSHGQRDRRGGSEHADTQDPEAR